jgi:large subunit ribosomal protein L6
MPMTDPIADFLTRIRNAIQAAHETVDIPSSKLKRELARILKEEGYISDFNVEPASARRAGEQLQISLRYTEARRPVISGLRRVSRPGRRTYADSTSIPKVQGGMGTTIVSTSRGVMTGHQARRERIGKQPIEVPAGVSVSISAGEGRVNGPKGELSERIPRDITVEQEESQLLVKRPTDRGEHRALHGLTRSLVANMVEGVTNGYAKTLEIQGVGYRAQARGRDLELALGYSHPVPIKAPQGIEFEVPSPTRIVVRGISKQRVGEVAANIRKKRPPEPYKGKGIRYEGEYVARKVGKRA